MYLYLVIACSILFQTINMKQFKTRTLQADAIARLFNTSKYLHTDTANIDKPSDHNTSTFFFFENQTSWKCTFSLSVKYLLIM